MSTAVHTFRIEGMHCASCALLIDDTLQDLPGVRSTRTSMKKGRSVVELEPDATPADATPADVIAAVGELGSHVPHICRGLSQFFLSSQPSACSRARSERASRSVMSSRSRRALSNQG